MKAKLYKTKAYQAEARPILISNELADPTHKRLVTFLQETFFKHHTVFPSCIYSIIEKLEDNQEFYRGYIFNTSRGWGVIARIDTYSFMCLQPDLNDIPWSPWQKSPSTAIKKLIEWSRYSFKQNKNKAKRTNKISLGYNPISQDTLDYCKVLGIGYPFTLRQLKKAYRELAFKHHPDTGDGDKIKLGKIYEAYKVLSLNI